jgi:two-component system chemotaxis sensor kinase CheA
VAIDKVDDLINMVGELVITQSMLNQIGDNFDLSRLPKLLSGLAQLERNTRELQESVMRIRMIPISFAFNRFPRLVHDLSAKLGKKIELKMTGEQTELDKTVMEKIGDPLVHLVRNSIDHGIEMPEARRACGKPETGTLHLNAYHQSGHIVIEIGDDGAGLNRERIVRKARERGLIKDESGMTDAQIHDLIFLPGFSTAEQVSDLSGRGVGMDVVRRNIKALGGNVEIRSTPGQGTTMIIRLPLTLAILDGQTVRVGQDIYLIPLVSIVESVQLADTGTVSRVTGKFEVIRLRDEYLPVLRLYQVFGLTPRATELDKGLLVVVEGEGHKAALFVDELLGQQQVVIKSLEANFQRVESIAGATILGDGMVALILDIPGLIRLAQRDVPATVLNELNHGDGIAA